MRNMNELEAKIRCLELGATICARSGEYHSKAIVEEAKILYDFTQAPPSTETSEEIADKQQRGRKPKTVDILS